MKVFFNTGEIITGPRSAVKRAIAYRKRNDPHLRYQFSKPFTEVEECVYSILSAESGCFLAYFYSTNAIRQAYLIVREMMRRECI